MTVEARILAAARELGATVAGIARVADLSAAPSSASEDAVQAPWSDAMPSVLIWGVGHPSSQPFLDWWNPGVSGYTPGNRILIGQGAELRDRLRVELGIQTEPLPYEVERGGVFLKDAAALAGLGVIGRHNLLLTPEVGTRVRLRAMLLGRELASTGPIYGFDPCDGCPAPCHRACPRGAFEGGTFLRARCREEMEANEAAAAPVDGAVMGIEGDFDTIKYCRNCELACPAGVLR